MDPENIAVKARNSLGKFCAARCKAKCCKNGKLFLYTIGEAECASGGNLDLLVKRPDGIFELHLKEHTCPRLKDNKCTAYKNKDRPKTCSDFPVYIRAKKIVVAKWCPGSKKLGPYTDKLKKMGYEIQEL